MNETTILFALHACAIGGLIVYVDRLRRLIKDLHEQMEGMSGIMSNLLTFRADMMTDEPEARKIKRWIRALFNEPYSGASFFRPDATAEAIGAWHEMFPKEKESE